MTRTWCATWPAASRPTPCAWTPTCCATPTLPSSITLSAASAPGKNPWPAAKMPGRHWPLPAPVSSPSSKVKPYVCKEPIDKLLTLQAGDQRRDGLPRPAVYRARQTYSCVGLQCGNLGLDEEGHSRPGCHGRRLHLHDRLYLGQPDRPRRHPPVARQRPGIPGRGRATELPEPQSAWHGVGRQRPAGQTRGLHQRPHVVERLQDPGKNRPPG